MASEQKGQLHIFFLPFMAPGHIIPTIDLARLFASRGVKSTIVTTVAKAAFFAETIQQDYQNLGIEINLITVKFPAKEAGLPEGCESADFSEPEMLYNFCKAISLLQHPFEKLVESFRPDCLVADFLFPWANTTAEKFGIPRLGFHGTGYFPYCIQSNLERYQPHKNISLDSETFIVPGDLPHDIKLTISELSPYEKGESPEFFLEAMKQVEEATRSCYGVIVNSFSELEPAYVDYCHNELGLKSWHIGPLLLYFKNQTRGRRSICDAEECIKWLDGKESNSVIYVCFGSMLGVSDAQLHEIALALEALGQNFILVVRKEWAADGFEDRVRGRGLIIRGWAPQRLILNHQAVGVFVTHCGWNSFLEGVTAGVPMVTWPLEAEQFCNEKLVTDVLKIGTQVGAKKWVSREKDYQEVVINSEDILKAMKRATVGQEAEGMRNRVMMLKAMAERAVSQGGSSCSDLDALIAEINSYKI